MDRKPCKCGAEPPLFGSFKQQNEELILGERENFIREA
jgi:hypothetical protein